MGDHFRSTHETTDVERKMRVLLEIFQVTLFSSSSHHVCNLWNEREIGRLVEIYEIFKAVHEFFIRW
jgi:hypothetical protein